MKKLLCVILLFSLASCGLMNNVPFKGKYADSPYSIHVNKSFDATWDNILNTLASKGIGIQSVDKASGVIVAAAHELSFTMEDQQGVLKDKTADVVVDRLARYYDIHVKGQWNFRLKQDTGGGTNIQMNLAEIDVTHRTHSETVPHINAQSSGAFEQVMTKILQ